MSDGYEPVKGKCMYWRESVKDEDRWDPSVHASDWKVACSCFVEGDIWEFTVSTVPGDCPIRNHCRYYLKGA